MSLSSAEKRELAAIERELAEDRTLTGLADRLRRVSRRGKRFGLPFRGLGWTITLLMSGIGLALFVAGVMSGKPAATAAAAVLAVLFQIPLVALATLTCGRHPRR